MGYMIMNSVHLWFCLVCLDLKFSPMVTVITSSLLELRHYGRVIAGRSDENKLDKVKKRKGFALPGPNIPVT